MRGALALGAVLFCVYAITLAADAAPGERLAAGEAHVLLAADSLVHDHDLDLSNQYADRSWRSWYRGTLRPTAAPDGAGRIFEPSGIGLPMLVAPAWAIGGVDAVKLWLALLTAAAFACAALLARRLVPDPWATGAALVGGLSPPAVAAATAIRPEAAASAALAGAAVLALAVRAAPRPATAFWAALLVAMVPWLGLSAVLPALVVALALAHWLRRRRHGVAGFAALEVVFTSAVVFVSIDERLYGGLTPYAARHATGPVTGIHDAGGALARFGRLGPALGDLVVWAPFALVAAASVWLLWRSRRDRIVRIADERVDVEVAAGFLTLACAAQVAAAAFLAPSLKGPWFDTRFLVPVLPLGAALAAWALRRYPRTAGTLAALTVALTVWLLAASVLGHATPAPPRGFGFPPGL